VEFLIVLVGMFAVMWLVLIRPQRRRQAVQAQMLANLTVGDEIVTAGGLYGHIRAVGDEDVTVEVAPGMNVRVAKRAVAAVLPKADELREEEKPEELEKPRDEIGA
jgi:preprotein translocase subunit YajC